MIRPPDGRPAAFTTDADGDLRGGDRSVVARHLGIAAHWATVDQVHGASIVVVSSPGVAGCADGLVTTRQDLPLAVFTADCAAVVIEAAGAIGVAHAGWRGAAAGVLPALLVALREAGGSPVRAAIGPTIGPCCFEVGPEVADCFHGFITTTTWGTTSVDLVAALRAQLEGVDVWVAPGCTRCGDGFYSHRRTGTTERMAGIGWIP